MLNCLNLSDSIAGTLLFLEPGARFWRFNSANTAHTFRPSPGNETICINKSEHTWFDAYHKADVKRTLCLIFWSGRKGTFSHRSVSVRRSCIVSERTDSIRNGNIYVSLHSDRRWERGAGPERAHLDDRRRLRIHQRRLGSAPPETIQPTVEH